MIPDSQSDGTTPEADACQNTNRKSPLGALPTSVSSSFDLPTGLGSQNELSELSSPRHGRCCDCPVHTFADLLSTLSRSLNEIKDEVIRLEVAFDALSASTRTYRCLVASCRMPAPRSGRQSDTH